MRTGSIKAGDIVEVDVRGHRCLARVRGRERSRLRIAPLCRGVSYQEATARQVVGHWRRSKAGS